MSISRVKTCLFGISLVFLITSTGASMQALTESPGKKTCPCSFQKIERRGRAGSFDCIGVFPISGGLNFSKEGIIKACKAFDADVVHIDNKLVKPHKRTWLRNAWFFIGPQGQEPNCAFMNTGGQIYQSDCEAAHDEYYMDMVLCVVNPWESETPLCKCPCGFMLDDKNRCVGDFIGCQPVANYSAMNALCYSLHPTVAVPLRLHPRHNFSTIWPENAIFYYGERLEDYPRCGVIQAWKNHTLKVGPCEEIINETNYMAVLCESAVRQFSGDCEQPRASCRANWTVICDNLLRLMVLCWILFQISFP